MLRAMSLWTLFIALPTGVLIAGPLLMNGFDVEAPASAEAIAIVRNGGFVVSCAQPFVHYLNTQKGKSREFHCEQNDGEAVLVFSPHAKNAESSAKIRKASVVIPIEYGKRFQGRTVKFSVNAKCPKSDCHIIASVNTGYTDEIQSHKLQFENSFSNTYFDFAFPAQEPDKIFSGPSLTLTQPGNAANADVVVKRIAMVPVDD